MRARNEQSSNIFQARETNKKVIIIKNKGLMRKSYLVLIAAAAGMLASCGNDLLLDNQDSAQAPIGFASYSAKATRGDATKESNLEFFHNTFVVYGTKKSTVDNAISQVFDGGETSLATYSNGATTPNDWTYSPYRYWDKQANYYFIAVAPNTSIIKYSWDKEASPLKEVGDESYDFVTVSSDGYTLQGQNLQKISTQNEIKKGFVASETGDVDLMTSALNNQKGNSHDTDVNLEFKHILAKLNVTVAKSSVLNDADVYVRSVEITKLNDNGKYAESNYKASAEPKVSGWNTISIKNDTYKLAYAFGDDTGATAGQGKELADYNTTANKTVPNYFIESLVMPQTVPATADDAATLILKYRIVTGSGATAHTEDYTYKFNLSTAFASFYDRCNYTLNFTIDPSVITFDASVAEWGNGGTSNQTID
jgi:hypothetical protein